MPRNPLTGDSVITALLDGIDSVGAKIMGEDNPSFKETLGASESGNDPTRVNTLGYMGTWQFGKARLKDYMEDTGEEFDNETFLADPKLQSRVFGWHVNNIHNYITKNNLGSYIGKEINGVPVTLNGLTAVAHLGGNFGMKKFLESGGEYNPADAYGTSLTDYLNKFKEI
jgi:hypothetical protein